MTIRLLSLADGYIQTTSQLLRYMIQIHSLLPSMSMKDLTIRQMMNRQNHIFKVMAQMNRLKRLFTMTIDMTAKTPTAFTGQDLSMRASSSMAGQQETTTSCSRLNYLKSILMANLITYLALTVYILSHMFYQQTLTTKAMLSKKQYHSYLSKFQQLMRDLVRLRVAGQVLKI